MSIIPAFGGRYDALSYAFGTAAASAPPPLQVVSGNSATGAQSITVSGNFDPTQGGIPFNALSVGSSISVGNAANIETVTITAVGTVSLSGFSPVNTGVTLTATFANTHGPQENVSSATFGLQEAINTASSNGGGEVAISPTWYKLGGTTAIIQAAVVPAFAVNSLGQTGTVKIVDLQSLTAWIPAPNSVTVVAAPSAATSATVGSLTTTGTWLAAAYYVLFTYVTADGGESIASSTYNFTATVSKAIGGTGPAASTGAVGYRVYIGDNATTLSWLVPVNSTNGTAIQCGPIAAFKIGTSFSVATITTAAALPPLVQSTAFPVGFQPVTGVSLQQAFSAVQGPFAATSTVTAGTAIEWAKVQIPAGYLNYIGRAVRITITGNYTPVSTATVIISVAIGSVYTGTETVVYTVTTPASSGTTNSVIEAQILMVTRVTGATGAVRCHGFNIIGLATGTAGLGAASLDGTTANSSSVNLTTQDYIRVTINSGTANLTTSQCDILAVETLAYISIGVIDSIRIQSAIPVG